MTAAGPPAHGLPGPRKTVGEWRGPRGWPVGREATAAGCALTGTVRLSPLPPEGSRLLHAPQPRPGFLPYPDARASYVTACPKAQLCAASPGRAGDETDTSGYRPTTCPVTSLNPQGSLQSWSYWPHFTEKEMTPQRG